MALPLALLNTSSHTLTTVRGTLWVGGDKREGPQSHGGCEDLQPTWLPGLPQHAPWVNGSPFFLTWLIQILSSVYQVLSV